MASLVNPCRYHLQKLALELKCPICLNLLNRPMLLPCDHILCNGCIPKSSQIGTKCQLCKHHYVSKDVRPAPYMENMVTIYRSLDATLMTDLLQPHTPVAVSDAGKVPQEPPASINVHVVEDLKEPVRSPQEGNSSNGKSTSLLTAKKPVRASHNSLNENKYTSKNGKSVPPLSSDQGKDKLNDNRQGQSGQSEGAEIFIGDKDVFEMIQSSSSTFPDDIKGLDSNCSSPNRGNTSIGKHPIIHSGEDCFRDSKRQKNLDDMLFDGCGASNANTKLNSSCSERIATSNSQSKSRDCSGDTLENLNPFATNTNICAFCHSSKATERTGPMLHYVNGKEVVGEAAMNSNAIHVHKICVEWAPKVYFDGETAKNLKGEIARAAQLKCNHCGIKGAALGCFMTTCRKTYHVSCAVEISGCRWDLVDFLLLCPKHFKVKFPSEKSKSGKHVREKQQSVPEAITSKRSSTTEVLHNEFKQMVFCGSALSSEEKYQLVQFASRCGAKVTKFWNPDVTHLIASTDSNGRYTRTLKVLKAILYGRWILKTDWIKESMEAMQPVDEEPYEHCIDNYGCCNGPKIGRLRGTMETVPKLFDGLNFYFTGDFVPGYKDDLLDLVRIAGGTILESKLDLDIQNHDFQMTSPTTLVVYNSGIMRKEEEYAKKERMRAAESFANENGAKVIDHTWLLESIASCGLKPF